MTHMVTEERKGYYFPNEYSYARDNIISFIDQMKQIITISIPTNMRIDLACYRTNSTFDPERDGFVDGNKICTDRFGFDFYYVDNYGLVRDASRSEEIINYFNVYFLKLIADAYSSTFNFSNLECEFIKEGNVITATLYSNRYITMKANIVLPHTSVEPVASILIYFCTNIAYPSKMIDE